VSGISRNFYKSEQFVCLFVALRSGGTHLQFNRIERRVLMQQMVRLSETNRQRESGISKREKSKREQWRKIFSFDEDGHVTVKKTCGMHQDQKREKDEAREKGSGNLSKRRVLNMSGLTTTACVQQELAGLEVMVEGSIVW
jgi:hypothetical protein